MQQYFLPLRGFVFAVALLLSYGCYGNVNDENMMCYKPPTPQNDNGLFDVDIKVLFPSGVTVPVTQGNLELHINGTCAVRMFVSYTIGMGVLPGTDIVCHFVNASSRHTNFTSRLFSQYYWPHDSANIVSHVRTNFTVDNIAASEGRLRLDCPPEFTRPVSGILNTPLVTSTITMELKGCPHARFGVHCDGLCSCAPGVECHPFTGHCVCPKGLHGELCSRAEPILVVDDTVFVRYGESATLKCTAYGMAPTLWFWERDLHKLEVTSYADGVPYRPRPFHLDTNITATGTEVNGVYTCLVMDNGLQYSKNVTVIVTNIPEPFLEAPTNKSVRLGQSVEFRCRTKPEAGTLTWVVGNRTINQWPPAHAEGYQTTRQSPVVRERNQTVSVFIESVRFEHVGRYRCIVGHVGGNDDAVVDATLTVLSTGSLKPFVADRTGTKLSQSVVRVHEGRPLNLRCIVREVYPEPALVWRIGNANVTADAKLKFSTSPNGVSVDVDSSLVFAPTWRNDRDSISCVCKVPSLETVTSDRVVVRVAYVPKVFISPREKTVQHDEQPLFKCEARSNPPVTSYNWTLQRKNGAVIRRYTGRSVKVQSLDPELNMAILTCYVTNGIGTNNSKAVIKVFDDPDDEAKVPWAIMISALSVLAFLMVAVPIFIYRRRGRIQELFFTNRTSPNQEDRSHDVFVAYKGGGDEEEFVVHCLVPKLQEWGCDVCVHYQNFLPGRAIADNILAAVGGCRKTLLVLSPDFMASEWCYFEFLCAVDEMVHHQSNVVIPLMFRDVRHAGLCQSMRGLLDTVSFIPWPGPGRGQTDEFWKLLKRAVGTEFNVNRERTVGELDEVNNNGVDAIDDNIRLCQV